MTENENTREKTKPEGEHRLLAIVKGTTTSSHLDIEIGKDEVLVWPHLLYREVIAVLLAIVILWVVSLMFNAPLEELANPNHSPNPAKAPWYFLGLQEMLVYFDPWIAGVLLPTFIVIGLMAIPYLDPTRDHIGSYRIGSRRPGVAVFTIGMIMWFALIIIGVVFRGPSWGWYWPWESWAEPREFSPTQNLPNIFGIPLVLAYFALAVGLPALVKRKWYEVLGSVRYLIVFTFTALIFGVLGKIILRLAFGVKYVITTPWFNI